MSIKALDRTAKNVGPELVTFRAAGQLDRYATNIRSRSARNGKVS